jgi:hypothetical protein
MLGGSEQWQVEKCGHWAAILAFSACFRTLVAVEDLFLDVHYTIVVQNLR